MISLDTNILVQFFAQDDAVLTERAVQVLSVRCCENNPGFVTSIVLVELFWTLRSHYSFTKEKLLGVLKVLLNAKEIRIEYPDEVRYAYDSFMTQSVDFTDVLIGAISKVHGCETTVTFDKKASRLPEFSIAE